MTSTELIKIREDRKLSKKEFAALLGITPMLLGRYEKGSCAIPDSVAKKLKETSDAAAATEIEVKKTVRKGGRKAKEAAEDSAALIKEAVEDKAVAEEIESKKTVRRAGRRAIKDVQAAVSAAKEAVQEAAGIPNIVIQSPAGGYITTSDIAKRVPKGTADVYVRVDENKLYYVLENGETGDLDIWD